MWGALTPFVWPDINLSAKEQEDGYIDKGAIEKLAAIAQEALKSQVESARLVIFRSYTVFGFVINLTVVVAGGLGVSTQAVTKTSGWLVHKSVEAAFETAGALLLVAAALLLWNILPREISLLGIHIEDFYHPAYLTNDPRVLQLTLVRHFGDSMKANENRLPGLRMRLRAAIVCVWLSPVVGACVWLFLKSGDISSH